MSKHPYHTMQKMHASEQLSLLDSNSIIKYQYRLYKCVNSIFITKFLSHIISKICSFYMQKIWSSKFLITFSVYKHENILQRVIHISVN